MTINLGGEGEVPGVLNQLGRWVVLPGWRARATVKTFAELVAAGHDFLLADDCCDEVLTNSLPPVDAVTYLGPTVQTSEIRRILKSGGRWIDNGVVRWIKP
jgi:hypothetical protein